MSRASEEILAALHNAVAVSLTEKIASGEASASDVSNALKMLKDNNITCTPGKSNALGELQAQLEQGHAPMPADQTDLQLALDSIDFGNARVN